MLFHHHSALVMIAFLFKMLRLVFALSKLIDLVIPVVFLLPTFSENRVILEAVSRFENAYVAFAGWLTELAALNPPPMEVLPVALGGETPAGPNSTSTTANSTKKGSLRVSLPHPASTAATAATVPPLDSPRLDGVVTPDDVGEVMARGNACFLAIQTAAEVGLSLLLVSLNRIVWTYRKLLVSTNSVCLSVI